MLLSELIEKYMLYLEYEKNSSPNTLQNYGLRLRRLIEHTGDKPIADINQMELLDWRMSLKKR